MTLLDTLTIIVFVAWCMSELMIRLITRGNLSRNLSGGADKFSYFIVWFSTVLPIVLAFLIRAHPTFANGFGSFSTLSLPLGYLGCLMIAVGITIRQVAVATLKKQFTLRVAIVEDHTIIETGIYGFIRHPAYLGHLAALLGMGLVLGNWVSLIVLVVLPLAGVLYRIRVEEGALGHYFGPAYQAYAGRTKRLLPGLW